MFRSLFATALLCGALATPTLALESASRSPAKTDWDAVKAAAAQLPAKELHVLAAFVAANPQGLAETSVPVLLLGSAAQAEPPLFAGQPDAYAAFYQLEAAQISILGSNSHLNTARDFELHHEVSAYESIGDGADYSFERFGAFYTLRITCDQPIEDTRCTQPDYLTKTAQTLVPVIGAK